MAVVKWSFKGTNFELNPFQDSGWIEVLKTAEVDLIDSDTTVIQTSGAKSRTRRIRGWISSASALTQWRTWLNLEGSLIDDLSNSVNCKLMSFTPERVFDIKNWNRMRYTATFIER